MAVLCWHSHEGVAEVETFADNRPAQLTFPKEWPDKHPTELHDCWFYLIDCGYADTPCSERMLPDGRVQQRIPIQRLPE